MKPIARPSSTMKEQLNSAPGSIALVIEASIRVCRDSGGLRGERLACRRRSLAKATAMPGQLPEPGQVFLDHVAHFVPDIEAAAAAMEGCGFRLTPFTAQVNRAEGGSVPAGTGNRCAMLAAGYVEILAKTSDTPLARQLEARLGRHVGLHLAAFSSADPAAERERLAAAGFPVLPLVDMRRPVGSEEAHFTIARIAENAMPEGRMQFLAHHTPD